MISKCVQLQGIIYDRPFNYFAVTCTLLSYFDIIMNIYIARECTTCGDM